MMSLVNQRRLPVDMVAEGGAVAGVDLLHLEGAMVVIIMRWKKLVDMMMDIMHHLCKDMKVAEEGAEVGAVGVVAEGAETKARDLLHSSRMAGASILGCHNLPSFHKINVTVHCNFYIWLLLGLYVAS